MTCGLERPRDCCQCAQTGRSPRSVVGTMMNPDTGIVHKVRRAWAYEDASYVSLCGLWWVQWWAERRTELVPA